jgi:hypothetical protein
VAFRALFGRHRELNLSDGEMAAVIAYLRTLPPVKQARARTEIRAPVRWFLKSQPEPLTGPVAEADVSDPVKRGKHLADIGLCWECHTPFDSRHRPLPGMDFAGGHEFVMVGVLTRAGNITPHASGLAHYTESLFLRVMRTGNVGGRRLSPLMPWYGLRHLPDEDLKALWAYLKTLPPVAHDVPRERVNLKDNPEINEHPETAARQP